VRNLEAMAPVEDAYDEAEDMMLESRYDEHSCRTKGDQWETRGAGDSFSM